MDIIISNSSNKPIYEQISSQIKNLIISGKLKPGDALPSMRLLAKELRISVITTKRAYDDLEKEGFIHSIPGKGTYVSLQNSELIREENLRKVEEHLQAAINLAKITDISLAELTEIMAMIYEEGE